MIDTSKIQEHMPVLDSDGNPVGTIDHLEDQRITLTRTDPDAGGRHHDIPCGLDRVGG